MLAKEHKLRGKKAIDVLAKTGKRRTSVFFIVKVKRNTLGTSRWVVVVSGKVHKSAVKRNRLRRQVREIIRIDLVPRALPLDVMVVVKHTALGVSYDELRADLLTVFANYS